MASPRLNAREGLASRSDGLEEQVNRDDLNQLIDSRIAAMVMLCNLMGGAGRYSGGADDETDLAAGGTAYPVFAAWILDRGGVPWAVSTTATKAITIGATGAVKLYAVLDTQADVTPAAAVGGRSDVTIVAQAAAADAPADSLLLGTGTVTGSAVTAFTGDAMPIAGPLARLDLAEVVTGLWRFGVNTLRVGDATDATITLLAHNADASKPGLRYNQSTNAWESSNDGTTWVAIVQSTDSRLTDARTPTAHKTSHQHGGSDEVATATPGANAIPKADGSGKLDSWLSDATTTLKGKVELATDGESAAGVVVQGNDARLSNARTPTAHKASHAIGGSDAMAAADLGIGNVRGLYVRTGNQTLTSGSDTDVAWQSRSDNVGLTWSAGTNPDRITIGAGEAGQYLVVALVGFASHNSGDRRAAITVNGTRVVWTIQPPPTTGAAALISLTWQGALAEGDILRLQVTQSSGGDLDFLYQYSSFRVIRLCV